MKRHDEELAATETATGTIETFVLRGSGTGVAMQ
jgi:hypothetical protein